MYRIGSVYCIDDGRYHVTVIGPPPHSDKIELRRTTTKSLQEVWEDTQEWCDDRNIDIGLVTQPKRRFLPTKKYKARSTVVFK